MAHVVVFFLHEVIKVLVNHVPSVASMGVNLTPIEHVIVALELGLSRLFLLLKLFVCLLSRNHTVLRLLYLL